MIRNPRSVYSELLQDPASEDERVSSDWIRDVAEEWPTGHGPPPDWTYVQRRSAPVV